MKKTIFIILMLTSFLFSLKASANNEQIQNFINMQNHQLKCVEGFQIAAYIERNFLSNVDREILKKEISSKIKNKEELNATLNLIDLVYNTKKVGFSTMLLNKCFANKKEVLV